MASYVWVSLLCVFTWILLRVSSAASRWRTRRKLKAVPGTRIVAFFHPYCNSGGGGERVLWRAIHALAARRPPLHIIVYTGDVDATPEQIRQRAKDRFGIPAEFSVPVTFIYLKHRGLLEARRYPVFTMIGQSLGSLLLACEALWRATPDVFFDSTGFAFTFLPAKLWGCRVGAYVHYPTISTDMLSRVRDKRSTYNNRSWIACNPVLSWAKLLYYRVFALIYGAMGTLADVVMVNSSWTQAHIQRIWKFSRPVVVFPPCDVSELKEIPLAHESRQRVALSVAQFRPEKDQALQLRALALLRDQPGCGDVRLVLLGSCRHEEDHRLVESLKALARQLGVEEQSEFVVNCDYATLKGWLGRASVGLHTMRDEHFGMGVVEMMAAGLITIAHRSGGPKEDIVVPYDGQPSGLLAETAEEFAEALSSVFAAQPSRGYVQMRQTARSAAQRYSNQGFEEAFLHTVLPLTR